jgi:hypothetical protein
MPASIANAGAMPACSRAIVSGHPPWQMHWLACANGPAMCPRGWRTRQGGSPGVLRRSHDTVARYITCWPVVHPDRTAILSAANANQCVIFKSGHPHAAEVRCCATESILAEQNLRSCRLDRHARDAHPGDRRASLLRRLRLRQRRVPVGADEPPAIHRSGSLRDQIQQRRDHHFWA